MMSSSNRATKTGGNGQLKRKRRRRNIRTADISSSSSSSDSSSDSESEVEVKKGKGKGKEEVEEVEMEDAPPIDERSESEEEDEEEVAATINSAKSFKEKNGRFSSPVRNFHDSVDARFEEYYMNLITSEFGDDLNNLRMAKDFNDKSLAMLVHSLKQGVNIFDPEEKRIVLGGGGGGAQK